MKFIIKNNIYEIGETRDRSGFLFFPKEILCDEEAASEIRWLRFAKWRQIYVSGDDFDNAHWSDFRWLD
jgi:hypothetical protein